MIPSGRGVSTVDKDAFMELIAKPRRAKGKNRFFTRENCR